MIDSAMLEKLRSRARTNRSKAFECSTAFRRLGVPTITDQKLEASFDPILLARADLAFVVLCSVVALTLVSGPDSVAGSASSRAALTVTLLSMAFHWASRIRDGFSAPRMKTQLTAGA